MWGGAPLAAFDLETTGPDPLEARIVTACIATIDGAEVASRNWLVDPEIPIPDGAAEVHGITTDKARSEGIVYTKGYDEIRSALETAWAAGRIVCAYNASFDFTVMDREGERLGYPPLPFGAIFDPFVVDRAVDKYRRGKRTLSVTCEHYGIAVGNAHAADADALAAARLAWKLGHHNPRLAELSVEELMAQQAAWHRERQLDYAAYLDEQGKDSSGVSADWPLRRVAS